MKFDNAQFEKNCKETMSTLDKLKEKLYSTKSASGLSDLGETAKGLGLEAVDKSLTSINKKMSILGIAGATVVSELTKSAMNFAKTVATTVPNIIKEGGWTRAMNIEQAKFQLEGLGIAWSQVGEQISNAVSGTAYSMDSAAKAASQLASSGVEISGVGDQMERTLKAISGVAAQTNSSYDEIANIFTTVAGNGRLMGDQLRQLSYRGMNAAAALAKAMGTTEEGIRDMVSKGQISFEQFSEIMFETFGENAFKANQTFKGSLDNMKAALKRTGEAFAGPVIRQTIPVFNALREAINKANTEVFKFSSNNVAEQSKFTDAIAKAKSDLEELSNSYYRGEMSIEEYREKSKELRTEIADLEQGFEDCLGPFEKIAKTVQENIVDVIKQIDFKFVENMLNGFVNILKAGWSVLKPFGKAFLEVFGITTENVNDNISEMAKNFEKFTSKLILTEEEMVYLKRAFKGIISVLSMGSYLIKTVLAAILGVNVNTINLRKSLLNIIGTIGSILYYITDTIKRTNIVGAAIKGVISAVYMLAGALAFIVSKIIDMVYYVKQTRLFQVVITGIQKALILVVGSVVLLAEKIAYIFTELRKGNISVLGPIAKVIEVIQTGIMLLVGGVATLIEKISHIQIVGDIVDKITAAFERLKEAVSGIFGKKKGSSGEVTITDEEVPKGMMEIADSVKEASGAAEEAGNNFGFLSNVLADFQKNMNLSKIASIAFTAAILVVAYKTADALQGIGKGVKGIGQFMGKFAKKGLLGMILGTQDRTPNKILDTAVALGVLSLALVGIANLPADKFKQASEAVTSLMIGFTGMMAVMTYLDQVSGTLGGIGSITDSMLKMTLAISGLAFAMSIFANMKGNIYKGIVGMVAATADLIGMAILLSKFAPKFQTAAGSLIGLALSLRLMATTFKMIVGMKDDVDGVYSVIMAFAFFTGTLVAIASLAQRVGGNSSFLRLSGSILALSVAMFLISKTLQKVNIVRMSNVLDKWSDFFRNNYLYFLGGVAIAVAGTVAAFKLVGLIPVIFNTIAANIQRTLRKTRSLGDEVKSTVDYLGKGINKLGVAAIILSATAAITALTVLFFAVAKLSKTLTPEEIKTARYILGDLVGMVIVLSLVSKATEKAKPTALLASILAIGTILGAIMAISLMVSGDLPGTIAGVVGVIAIMAGWIVMMKQMAKINYDESSYKGIIASIAGIGVIVYGIRELSKTFNEYGIGSYIASIAGLGVLMVALGGLLKLVGSKGMVISAQKRQALLEIIGAVGAIALGIMGIMWVADGDYTAIKAAALALGGVMAVFGAIATFMGSIKWDPGTFKAFLGIATTAAAIGGVLSVMVAVIGDKYDQLTAAVTSLLSVAIVFAGIATVLSNLKNAQAGMVLLLGIAASASIFALTLTAMVTIVGNNYTRLFDCVLALTSTAMLFSVIAGALGSFTQSALGMIILNGIAISTVLFASSLSMLAKYDVDKIKASVIALIAVAGALSVLAAILGAGPVAAMAAIGTVILTGLASAFMIFSLAASLLAVNLTMLLPVLSTFVNDIMTTMAKYKDDYLTIGLSLVTLSVGLGALGTAGVVLGVGSVGLIAGSVAIGLLSVALKSLGEVPFTVLQTGISGILAPLLGLGMVSAVLFQLTPAIIASAAALYIFGAAVKSIASVMTAEVIVTMSKIPVQAYSIGEWVPLSLAKGILSKKSVALLAGTVLASGVEEAIRNVLQIHSNSPKFNTIGEWIPISMETGIDNGMGPLLQSVGLNMEDLAAEFDISDEAGQAGADTGEAFVKEAVTEIDSGIPLLDMLLYKIKQKFEEAKSWITQINDWADEAQAESSKTNQQKNAGKYRGAGGESELTKKQREAKKNSVDTSSTTDDYTEMFDGISSGAGGASKSVDSLTSSVEKLGSAFETVSKGSKVSMGNLINNVKENIQESLTYAMDLRRAIERGYDETIVEWLKSLGKDGHETIKAFANASEEEAAELQALMPQYLTVDEVAQKIINGDYQDSATQAMMAFASGMQVYSTQLAETIQNAIDPFSKFDEETEMTGATLLENMRSQISGITKWSDNIVSLIGRIPESMIEYFQELGPSSYEEVAAMASMTEGQLAEATELWNQQLELGQTLAMQQAARYQEVGAMVTQGFLNGLDTQAMIGVMGETAESGAQDFEAKYGIHSPSRRMFQNAVYICKGLILGLRSGRPLVTTEVYLFGNMTIRAFEFYLNFDRGHELGHAMCQGIISGLRDGENAVTEMARVVAHRAYMAAREELDINSPSKKFREIGLSADEGFAQGIDRGSYWVTDSISELGSSAIDKMTEVIRDISNNINGDFENMSPVISPRLNLEGIQNGRSLIDRMFGGTGYEISSSIVADQQQQSNVNQIPTTVGATSNNQTIIFNQTNNSPKNIDPYESYRLNRLAAEQLKGAFR